MTRFILTFDDHDFLAHCCSPPPFPSLLLCFAQVVSHIHGAKHKRNRESFKPFVTLMDRHIELLRKFQTAHPEIRYMNQIDPEQAVFRHLIVDALYEAGGNAGCK